jgi:crotonobetainyl-CoA:carnitine CoA-transferase CaiB-like acyl-CoA transferase
MRSPVTLNGQRGPLGHAPGYGEHTRAVLSEIGYSEDEIAELLNNNVIK